MRVLPLPFLVIACFAGAFTALAAEAAAQQPARVKEMAAQREAWAQRVGVRPWPLGSEGGKEKGKAGK
jgi:hypothetical protein